MFMWEERTLPFSCILIGIRQHERNFFSHTLSQGCLEVSLCCFVLLCFFFESPRSRSFVVRFIVVVLDRPPDLLQKYFDADTAPLSPVWCAHVSCVSVLLHSLRHRPRKSILWFVGFLQKSVRVSLHAMPAIPVSMAMSLIFQQSFAWSTSVFCCVVK